MGPSAALRRGSRPGSNLRGNYIGLAVGFAKEVPGALQARLAAGFHLRDVVALNLNPLAKPQGVAAEVDAVGSEVLRQPFKVLPGHRNSLQGLLHTAKASRFPDAIRDVAEMAERCRGVGDISGSGQVAHPAAADRAQEVRHVAGPAIPGKPRHHLVIVVVYRAPVHAGEGAALSLHDD